MKAAFGYKDQEKNAKLILDLTAHGFGMSSKAFKELPEIKPAQDAFQRMRKALEFVQNNMQFPAELPAFDPSVSQTPTTDGQAVGMYEEFKADNQILYAGGNGGTIWMRVSPDFPVGIMKYPFAVVGFTSDGHAVLRQSYVGFLRQFLPDSET